MKLIYDDLQEFYKEVEAYSGDCSELVKKLQALRGDVTEELKKHIDWEKASLEFSLEDGEVRPMLSSITGDGKEFGYPNYELFENGGYEYLISRLSKVGNNNLLARYSHILWCGKSKDQKYAKIAIDNYLQLFNDSINTEGFDIYKQFGLLKNGVILAFQIKYKTEYCKELINRVLFEKSFFDEEWKIAIIEFLLDHSWFKGKDFKGVIELLEGINKKLANVEKYNDIKRNLEVVVKVANKSRRSPKPYIKQLGWCFEKMAEKREDDESNMIPILFLVEALAHYESIKETESAEKVAVRIHELKKDFKLGKFQVPLENADKLIKPLLIMADNLLKEPPQKIYAFLACDTQILFPKLDSIKKKAKNRPMGIKDLFHTINFDINTNISNQQQGETEKEKNYLRNVYSIHMNIVTWSFLYNLFDKGFKNGVISFDTLIEFLNTHTWLGKRLSENRAGDELVFSWVEMIAPALHEFFIQLKLIQHTEKQNLIMVIDSLTLKVEGVFRDLAKLLGIQTITTNRKSKNGGTRTMYIEELLAEPKMQEYFDENDRMFLDFLFLGNGLNLRNNIAHAFYRPDDYSMRIVLFVILAIFRLSKYQMDTSK